MVDADGAPALIERRRDVAAIAGDDAAQRRAPASPPRDRRSRCVDRARPSGVCAPAAQRHARRTPPSSPRRSTRVAVSSHAAPRAAIDRARSARRDREAARRAQPAGHRDAIAGRERLARSRPTRVVAGVERRAAGRAGCRPPARRPCRRCGRDAIVRRWRRRHASGCGATADRERERERDCERSAARRREALGRIAVRGVIGRPWRRSVSFRSALTISAT